MCMYGEELMKVMKIKTLACAMCARRRSQEDIHLSSQVSIDKKTSSLVRHILLVSYDHTAYTHGLGSHFVLAQLTFNRCEDLVSGWDDGVETTVVQYVPHLHVRVVKCHWTTVNLASR